ncbi:MAG: DUF2059 domain-containing protein [Proteobacteria bacterium]|nr:DUF2059 domain-containing protein [Pseudomonadota bacterium]
MKSMFIVFIAVLSFSISPLFADAEISDAKRSLIDNLLQQTGQSADEISNQIITSYIHQITSVIKQSEPDLHPSTLQEIAVMVAMTVKQQVVEQDKYKAMIYPIYDRHFAKQELQTIIEFNQTELGKKLLQAMPLINDQHQYIFGELSLDLAPEVNKRILETIKQAEKP